MKKILCIAGHITTSGPASYLLNILNIHKQNDDIHTGSLLSLNSLNLDDVFALQTI